jgi:hypothetical protein
VTLSVSVPDPRRTVSSTLSRGSRAAIAATRLPLLDTALPPMAVTMSPVSRPAAAVGLPAVTEATRAPVVPVESLVLTPLS